MKQGCEEEEDYIKKKKHCQCCTDLATKRQKKTGQVPNDLEKACRERERGRAEVHMMTIMRATTASAREQDAQSQKLYPEYESICSCVGTILAH